jgi:hypothetical protein
MNQSSKQRNVTCAVEDYCARIFGDNFDYRVRLASSCASRLDRNVEAHDEQFFSIECLALR